MTTKNPIIRNTTHKLYDEVLLYPLELEKETCSLCLEKFKIGDDMIKLKKCTSHFYHKDCDMGKTIAEWVDESGKCPSCFINYGIQKTWGPDGDMNVTYHGRFIYIVFNLRGGIHPETKKRYYHDSRQAYLPNTKKGKEVLELFRQAHSHRLLFTVGHSLTRNIDNVIIYNGIHMKTSLRGSHGLQGDKGYLDRVIKEFETKGIIFQR